MFVGHYSAALAGKALEPRVPLWVMLLAAQLVDVAWVLLVLLGVEKLRIDPALPSNPLDLYHMPYTHSLLGTGVFAGAAALATLRLPGLGGVRRAGLAVAVVVASHWLLDLLVHRPDLTLWGTSPRLGLGLWDAPAAAQLLELACLVAAATLYGVRLGRRGRALLPLAAGVGALALLQLIAPSWPIPPSPAALVLLLLLVFATVVFVGWRAERAGATASAEEPAP